MLAVYGVSDGRRDDADLRFGLPDFLAGVGLPRAERAVAATLKDEIAGCCQDTTVPEHLVLVAPDFLLGDRIPGDQVALD